LKKSAWFVQKGSAKEKKEIGGRMSRKNNWDRVEVVKSGPISRGKENKDPGRPLQGE